VSFDYLDVAQTASELLRDSGSLVTLTRVTGTYNPDTGVVGSTGATFAASGVRLDYSQRDIDGTLVKRGDQRVYIDPFLATTPQTGDTITIGSEVFTVVNSRPLAPAGVVVLHDVQVRA
jgi:hypothetical protein